MICTFYLFSNQSVVWTGCNVIRLVYKTKTANSQSTLLPLTSIPVYIAIPTMITMSRLTMSVIHRSTSCWRTEWRECWCGSRKRVNSQRDSSKIGVPFPLHYRFEMSKIIQIKNPNPIHVQCRCGLYQCAS